MIRQSNESERISDEGERISNDTERILDEGERISNDAERSLDDDELSLDECVLAVELSINLLDSVLARKQHSSFYRRSHEGRLPPLGSLAGVF